MKLLQNRHAIGGLHMPALRAFQLRAFVPRVHNQQNRQCQQHGEPATVQELRHRSEEEQELDGQERHCEHDRADALAIVPNVDGQQNRRGDHRDGQCQAVCGGNMLRIAEHRQNQQGGDAQHGVDHRNVQLAAGTSRIAHLQVGHPVESRRFGNHGVGAGDQRLRSDHAGAHGQQHRHVTYGRGHHFEERIEAVHVVVRGVVPMVEHPRALAEIAEHKGDLDERPREVDVAAADVAHVGIQRFGAGGGQEHGAHDGEACRIVVAEEELHAVHRIQRFKHAPIGAQVHQADDGEEREPDHDHRAERAADAFGTARLHCEQADDDHNGDHQRQFFVFAHDRFQQRQCFQAFHCRADRDGRRKHGIGEERGAAQHGGNRKPCPIFADQRIQCEDAAFAVVVDAHGDEHVFDGGDQRDRPEDQRQDAQHRGAIRMRQTALAVEERLHGVQRRGTDVAVYHAKRHDGHGRRDLVRAGLETAPPAADAALAGGLVKFRGFLLLRLVLLDERLALLLGQDLVRDLWRLRVRRCVKQRLFFFVRLVSHNASSKWRAFQPAPQNKTQGVTLGAWQTIVKSSHVIRHVTHEIHICLIVCILLIFWRLRNCYVEAHATVTEPPQDYREIAILFRCRTLRASFHAWLWRFQPTVCQDSRRAPAGCTGSYTARWCGRGRASDLSRGHRFRP